MSLADRCPPGTGRAFLRILGVIGWFAIFCGVLPGLAVWSGRYIKAKVDAAADRVAEAVANAMSEIREQQAGREPDSPAWQAPSEVAPAAPPFGRGDEITPVQFRGGGNGE